MSFKRSFNNFSLSDRLSQGSKTESFSDRVSNEKLVGRLQHVYRISCVLQGAFFLENNLCEEHVVKDHHNGDAIETVDQTSMPRQCRSKILDVHCSFKPRREETDKWCKYRCVETVDDGVDNGWRYRDRIISHKLKGQGLRVRLVDRQNFVALEVFEEPIVKPLWGALPEVSLQKVHSHDICCNRVHNNASNKTFYCLVWRQSDKLMLPKAFACKVCTCIVEGH